jgi:GT2 family glycosyltransferase
LLWRKLSNLIAKLIWCWKTIVEFWRVAESARRRVKLTTYTLLDSSPLSDSRLIRTPALTRVTRPSVVGKFIHVRDDKFYVKGVTYGAFRPDSEKREYSDSAQIERDFSLMAANGINTVRIPHTMPPRSLLDIALRHDLRVMVGLSAEQYIGYLIDVEKKAPNIEAIVRQKVSSVKGHPALLCYAIGNEIAAPVARWLGRYKVERYLRNIFNVAKDEDPGGLITYVNYPSTEYLQLPFFDLVCFNVYLENEDRYSAYLARLQNIAGDRPLIMSEVGLDAMRNGEAKQTEVLDWQIRSSFASGCAGVVLFSWTDEWYRAGKEVEDWAFGITDRQRRPKQAMQAVREAFSNVPFRSDGEWPRISVAICTYNGAGTIRKALEGLKRVEYPNFEVIVVNDGSTDETAAIAGEYECRVITTENAGLSSARNTALRAADGEIIAYLDDDAIPDRHWLHYLASTFLKTDYAAVGGPNIAPPNGNTIADCVDNAPGGPVHVLLTDEIAEHLPGCNFAIRKSCLEAVGGFDPTFRVAGDDVDLCWRLQQRGWLLGFSPGAAVLHHRRNTIPGYWKQQCGYGNAEAFLERKWPDKYNSAGHHTFSGRVYGHGMVHALFRRTWVYHGVGGFAPFQSLYERASGIFGALPLMPEWYLLIALFTGLSFFGFLWKPFFLAIPFAVGTFVLSLIEAIIGGWDGSFDTAPRPGIARAWRRCLTAFLHLLQPLARLSGRLSSGLTIWRRRGLPGFAVPFPRSSATWTENWQAPEDRLAQIERSLHAERAVVWRGGNYDRWDLEIVGGAFASVRMLMAVEDHGAGTQLVRIRSWPRCRNATKVLASFLGIVFLLAAFDAAWSVVIIFGATLVWLLWIAVGQAGQSTAALLRAKLPRPPIGEQRQEQQNLPG